MNHNLEIQKILLKIQNLKNAEDQIILLKQAISLADANNDEDWGFDLRMDLIRTEQFTAHSEESFPAFAWILNTYDNTPDLYSEEDILQEYKWLAAVSYNNLRINRKQIEDIFEDFKSRCLKGGFSLREYYNIITNYSLFMGDKIAARKHLNLRDKEASDTLSSWSNDMITTIYVEMFESDFDKAIVHINDFVNNQSSHKMNSIPVYSGLIYYLGGKMNDKRVTKYFNEADDEFSKLSVLPFQLYEVTLMMYYMSKKNKTRAWAYFEKYVNLELDAEPAVRFDFAASVLHLLKIENENRILDMISNRQPYYREDNTYHLKDLYNYYLDMATNLAKRFDERNGNAHFMEQLDEVLSFFVNNENN